MIQEPRSFSSTPPLTHLAVPALPHWRGGEWGLPDLRAEPVGGGAAEAALKSAGAGTSHLRRREPPLRAVPSPSRSRNRMGSG